MPEAAAFRWQRVEQESSQLTLDGLGPDHDEPSRDLAAVEYLHVRAGSIISEVPRASRMPFRYTINVYRGCSHACTYCFARPTHEYLGLNGAEDSSAGSWSR